MSRQLHLHSLPNEPEVATAYGDWIRDCIVRGQSWPAMVEALLTTTGDSHSRGAANFARMAGDARAHAELVSEVFLSAKMGCANCHDHRWIVGLKMIITVCRLCSRASIVVDTSRQLPAAM